MYRGTTPTYTFTMPEGVDLTLADEIYVTFCKTNDALIMTKTGADLVVSSDKVDVFLTQEETLAFPNGFVQVQLNWLYQEEGRSKRACSNKMRIKAEKNLIDEVL